MKNYKYILFIGSILIFIFSIVFFNIRTEQKIKYDIIVRKLAGIAKITDIHRLDILIKNIRGLNQLEKSQITELKRIYLDSKEDLQATIQKLNDKKITEFYFSILKESDHLSKSQIFKRYTKLLKLLQQKTVDVADSSYLLFNNNREVYLLMSIVALKIPMTIENIGKIRGIGVTIFGDLQKEQDKRIFLLKKNIDDFVENIDNIKFTVSKLSFEDSNRLITLLDSIMTDFDMVNLIVTKLIANKSNLSAPRYFLKISKLINNINNFFLISKEMLTNRLVKQKHDLERKLILGLFLYVLFVLITLLAMFKNYFNSVRVNKINQIRREQQKFINTLQEEFIKEYSLKQICNKSLNKIVKEFSIINASLYLFDNDNKKLYLGATYAIKPSKLKQTLELHENLLSENLAEKKIRITDVDQKVNLGNIVVHATKLVTIPISKFEKTIGSIQLLFDNHFEDVDFDFLLTVLDLIASYIYKAQKDEESKRYLKLIDKNVLISHTDLYGNIIQVSDAFCQLSQYTKEELIGNNHRILKHQDMPDITYVELWQTISQGLTWRGEIKNLSKHGKTFWVDSIIMPDRDINGNIIGYTAIRTNITDKKILEEIAITDSLTTLYNRRHFDTLFSQKIRINRRLQKILAFMLIDIDHFKLFNDTYGHQAGDQALKQVAYTLKGILKRPDDNVFRLGGEEFAMLYQVGNEQDACIIAELARKGIEQLKIIHSNNSASRYVTISAGLYIIKADDPANEHEIYKKTDEALYLAKKNGRNQVKQVSD